PRLDRKLRGIMRLERERRKQVVEYRDIVFAGRKLSRVCRIRARAQRVVLGRRQKSAVLSIRCISNPLAAQRMPTIMRVRSHRLGARTRHFTDISDLTPAEQSDLASIRLRELELMHVADGPFASPRHQFSSL